MYSCTMAVPDPGAGGGGGGWGHVPPIPHEEDVSVLKQIRELCVRKWFGGVWGGLGWFNVPHDGYATDQIRKRVCLAL